MMLKDIDQFFWDMPEPAKSCLAALRHYVLHYHPDIAEVWKYSMPFYNYRGKRVCYIWIKKKTGCPYLGIVNGNLLEHPSLIAEKRSRMKIMVVDPKEDLPVETMDEILEMAIGAL